MNIKEYMKPIEELHQKMVIIPHLQFMQMFLTAISAFLIDRIILFCEETCVEETKQKEFIDYLNNFFLKEFTNHIKENNKNEK